MRIHRGPFDRQVSFDMLKGGDEFLGSVTGRKLLKLSGEVMVKVDKQTYKVKNCVNPETGKPLYTSDDDVVTRGKALKVRFGDLGEGNLFRGTETPAVFIKTAVNIDGVTGRKTNCVRCGNGSTQHFYLADTMVEPLEGDLEVEGM
jgi:hypothetical protein